MANTTESLLALVPTVMVGGLLIKTSEVMIGKDEKEKKDEKSMSLLDKVV